MKKFRLFSLPMKENIEEFKNLIGARLHSIQAVKIEVRRSDCVVEGLCKIDFYKKTEDLKINYNLDLFSQSHQNPITEDLHSLKIDILASPMNLQYTTSGKIIHTSNYPLLNAKVTNHMRGSKISKISFHGMNKKGDLKSDSFFMKEANFESYYIQVINRIIFYHSNGALTDITAGSFNRIFVNQFIEEEKRINRIIENLSTPLFEIQ
ncbi:MAG: hypothetical protein AB8H03_12000 [Saprospiraceae bacterium]